MDLDELNMSELVLLAQDHEPEAHRGMDRELLIHIARGGEAQLPTRQVNKVRLRIMEYIIEHWTQVEPLLGCPAKSKSPRACFQCPDIQAVECALTNKDMIFGTGKD